MKNRFPFHSVHGSCVPLRSFVLLVAIVASGVGSLRAQDDKHPPGVDDVRTRLIQPGPDLADLDPGQSEMRGIILRYAADSWTVERLFPDQSSETRRARVREFCTQWLDTLDRLEFGTMSLEGRVDYIIFRNYLQHRLSQLELQGEELSRERPFMPFAPALSGLEESRMNMQRIDAAAAAALLDSVNAVIGRTRAAIAAGMERKGVDPAGLMIRRSVANRSAERINDVRSSLKAWFDFYNGYDPLFSWWVAEPYKTVDQTLKSYGEFLREKVAGISAGDDTTIVGYPIGREALMKELRFAMVPYTPEELIAIADKEYAWCEAEMKKASREMGFGDDWHRALDRVKAQHVDPGQQPELIRRLALEAMEFVDSHNLITVPDLARTSWGMEMLSPEQQMQSPFFLGGEDILVAYPTSSMSQEQKMMSMRGNNVHFARATVFHELIPGHHLQWYMNARYRTYRGIFGTPFWTEGWSFYWEMLFWDMDFARTPEDRVGMLFWRMHRCARIVFSLKYHLGLMTPEECVDYLVSHVGHERANAAAEVRRSFAGGYGPLYQCAYMVGALQFRALHNELVGGGMMSDRSFHDAILKENNIPIEMVRAVLTKQVLSRDFAPHWRFAGSGDQGPGKGK